MQTLSAGRIRPNRSTAEAIRTTDPEAAIGELVATFLARAVANWDDESDQGEGSVTQHSECFDWRLSLPAEPVFLRVGGKLFDVVEATGSFCGHSVEVSGRYVAGKAAPRIVEQRVIATIIDADAAPRVLVHVVGTILATLVRS